MGLCLGSTVSAPIFQPTHLANEFLGGDLSWWRESPLSHLSFCPLLRWPRSGSLGGGGGEIGGAKDIWDPKLSMFGNEDCSIACCSIACHVVLAVEQIVGCVDLATGQLVACWSWFGCSRRSEAGDS